MKRYPSDSSATTRRLARLLGLNPQAVAMANGSTELVTWIDHLLAAGERVDAHRLREEDGSALDVDDHVRFVRERTVRMLDELHDLDLVEVDESFLDLVDAEPECSVAAEVAVRHDVVVLKSPGGNFGLHGTRFGPVVADPALTARIVRPSADVERLLAGLRDCAARAAGRG
ncbi:hypothetical protein MN205_09315 [Kineococcus sp. TRM81007]|uniref:hypothetical protein n=1 Tax=Kineococcus sp. TRM81007 TaxID=2925831 RepID=UPI001F584C9E|nr:hypothetical protein [Kineococcus sp. TRM81007]MCI2238694.1 hypothetical protein [Kineococcus sp. TRM81007]